MPQVLYIELRNRYLRDAASCNCQGSCFSLQVLLVPRAARRGRTATRASLTDVRKATDIVSRRFFRLWPCTSCQIELLSEIWALGAPLRKGRKGRPIRGYCSKESSQSSLQHKILNWTGVLVSYRS